MALKIQYRDSTGTYVDAPARLYCLLGQTIHFKAVSTAANPNYAATSWSTGATGQTVAVPMAVVSAANTIPAAQTVRATLAGEQAEVKVTVWSLTATVTPVRASPAPRTNPISLRVDERANLGFTMSPAGVTAANVGGLRWTLTGASPNRAMARKRTGLLLRSATDNRGPDNDGRAHYFAPYLTDDGTPYLPVAKTKTVQLDLVIQSGPCQGQNAAQQNITIHCPTAVMVMRVGTGIHKVNHISAGFLADIYLTPDSVNFETLEFREAGGRWTTHTGTFSHLNGAHPPATIGTNGVDVQIVNARNHVGGPNTGDTVYTIGALATAVPPLVPNHTGRGTWEIYWQYRVRQVLRGTQMTDTGWVRFQIAQHDAQADALGNCTQSKEGATVTYPLATATTAQATSLGH